MEIYCRSWLACDSIISVQLIHRGACIAGKPAPTEIVSGLGGGDRQLHHFRAFEHGINHRRHHTSRHNRQ